MGIQIYTGNRLELLIDELSEEIASVKSSLFEPESIVVQSKGMERWLKLQLASRIGVCGNVRCPFPKHLMLDILDETMGIPENDNYMPEVLSWRIYDLLPSLEHTQEFEVVKDYLEGDNSNLKRYQLSERLASLYDLYQTFRPNMMLEWGGYIEGNALSEPISAVADKPENRWQRILWKKLLDERPEKTFLSSLAQFMKLDLTQYESKLPESINLFGMSFLPPMYMSFFSKLAEVTKVNIFYLNPCREYWEDCVNEKLKLKFDIESDVEGYWEVGNPLLSSMGRLGRDFSRLINGLDNIVGDKRIFYSSDEGSLLEMVQGDMLSLSDPSDMNERRIVKKSDRSIRVHIAHSPMREIEILYDQILDMINSDPELQPRDILVMAPDIQSYSPYIKAVFDNPEESFLKLPYSIADRSPGENNPVAEAFIHILQSAQKRYKAEEVLEILETPSVYRHFGLIENDLEVIRRWVKESGIRWGIDSDFREKIGFPGFEQNSWHFGEDRLMLGYAVPEEEGVQKGVLPYDVEGAEAIALGKFFHFVETLFSICENLRVQSSRDVVDWEARLNVIISLFFKENNDSVDDLRELRLTVNLLLRNIKRSESGELSFDVLLYALKKQLDDDNASAGFLHGGITFCRMRPMRSIPSKVICMIGLNDGGFPRVNRKSGFDIMAQQPYPGDRNNRLDDRYLFLETIISARKQLYASYIGRSIKDNSELPPSVLLSELIDYLNENYEFENGGSAEENLFVEHPLQAYSPKYYSDEYPELFSYSKANFRGAVAVGNQRVEVGDQGVKLGKQRPEIGGQREMAVEDLIRFFAHPAKFYLRDILNTRMELNEGATIENEEPISFNKSDYFLNRDLIEAMLRSDGEYANLYEHLSAKGIIPYGELGKEEFSDHLEIIDGFTELVKEAIGNTQNENVQVDLIVNNTTIKGELQNYYNGVGCVLFNYSSNEPKYLLQAWLEGLVLKRQGLDVNEIYSIYRKNSKPCCKRLELPDKEKCLNILEELIEVFCSGCEKGIPLFPKSSWEFARKFYGSVEDIVWDEHTLDVVRKNWYGNDFNSFKSEGEDNYNRTLFGMDYFDNASEDELEEFEKLAFKVYGEIVKRNKG